MTYLKRKVTKSLDWWLQHSKDLMLILVKVNHELNVVAFMNYNFDGSSTQPSCKTFARSSNVKQSTEYLSTTKCSMGSG